MIQACELNAPTSPPAPREISQALREATALQSVPELARQMERYQAELKGRLQRLEDLILRSGKIGDAEAGFRELTHSRTIRNMGDDGMGDDGMGDDGSETVHDKESLTPAMIKPVVGNNDLPAIAQSANGSLKKINLEEDVALETDISEDVCQSVLSGEKDDCTPKAMDPSVALQQSTMLSSRRSVFATTTVKYEDNCCGKVVGDVRFDHACALLIIVSSLMVGVEVQYKTESTAFVMDMVGYVFVGLFTLELYIRVKARGLRRYFNGLDYGWSYFDVFCVCSSYMEVTVSAIQTGNSGSFLLVVRTLRVVRIARIIRVIRFLGKLRMMVYTMMGAMRMLGWAVLLLGMVMYMFSVVFTEAVKPMLSEIEGIDNAASQVIKDLGEDHFGDLYVSMLTLFESITGGVSWHEPLRVLKEASSLYVFMFLFYICVTILTIMNVITGLCCDYAIQNAVTDRADVIKHEIVLKDRWRSQFATMFKAMDEDGSGEVSSEELRQQLQEEEFQAYLSHLNISVDDALELLEVLDSDHDGSISLEEFVTGCMRVKGQAKTIDLMKIMRECVLTRMAVDKRFNEIDQKFSLHMTPS